MEFAEHSWRMKPMGSQRFRAVRVPTVANLATMGSKSVLATHTCKTIVGSIACFDKMLAEASLIKRWSEPPHQIVKTRKRREKGSEVAGRLSSPDLPVGLDS